MITFKIPKIKQPKWFTWHLFPFKGSRIHSVYEIVFFLIFLAICLWAYGKVNIITTHSYSVNIECLNAKDIKDKWNSKVIPSAAIKYCLPMTETFLDTTNHYVSFKTVIPTKPSQERFCYFLEHPIIKKFDSDSLTNKYHQYHAKESKDTSCCLYYIKATQSVNEHLYGFRVNQSEDSIGKDTIKGKYVIRHIDNHISLGQEIYNMFSSSCLYENKWEISDINGTSMSNPGWFAAFDISQAYYDIKLLSSTIDSLTLEIDFVGATNFSRMEPEPDIVTMNSVKFTQPEKILTIKKNGLRFHAKFIEMENRQTIRIFFLTAIMCSLISLFMMFVVVGLYKLIIGIKSK